MRKNNLPIKLIIYSILLSSFLNIFLLISFKKIRSIFPPPAIADNKLIGFAQYYGYSFYFDTIFFFFLIAMPILVFMCLLYFYTLSKKK